MLRAAAAAGDLVRDVRNRLHDGLRRGLLGLAGSREAGSSTSRRLDVAAVALPPLARSRGIRLLGHARGGRPSGRPHLFEGRHEVLARDAQFLGQLVNPHMSPITRCRSFPSLAAASAVRPVRSARANARLRTAASTQPRSRWTYAPRPGADPEGRRPPRPRATRTTRSSSPSVPSRDTRRRFARATPWLTLPRAPLRDRRRRVPRPARPPRREPRPRAGSSSATAAGSSAARLRLDGGLRCGRGGVGRRRTRLVRDLRLGLDVDPPSGQRAARRAFCPSLPIASDSW